MVDVAVVVEEEEVEVEVEVEVVVVIVTCMLWKACGEIFCNPCSNEKANILGYREPQRVCQVCHKKLSAGFHAIKQVEETENVEDDFLLEIRKENGNHQCVDCRAPGPTYVLTNYYSFCDHLHCLLTLTQID